MQDHSLCLERNSPGGTRGCHPFQLKPDSGKATAPSLFWGTGAIRRMRPAFDYESMTRLGLNRWSRHLSRIQVEEGHSTVASQHLWKLAVPFFDCLFLQQFRC